MNDSADVAITTVTSVLAISSIVGNSLVCAVIVKNKDMRIPVYYLLVNLAVADIIYSTYPIPKIALSHSSIDPDEVTGKVLCTLSDGSLALLGAASSVVTLVAIATERYFAVIHPHENKGKLTTHKLKVIILGSWVVALIIQTRQLLKKESDQETCVRVWPGEWMHKVNTVIWFALVVLPFALMVGLYSRVVYTSWFKCNPGDNELIYQQQQEVLKGQKRITLMVVAVSLIFGISWGTDTTLHLLKDVASYKLKPVVFPVANEMIMFNSAFKPFAYALLNQQFRKKVNGMICCSTSSSAPRVHAAREPHGIELSTMPPSRPTQQGRSEA